MTLPIELNIGGIKCDNAECNYRDDSVKVEEYDKWLNKPCPQCKANLLTEVDYKQVQKLIATANFINAMTPEELAMFANYQDENERVAGSIELDGTGKMIFTAFDGQTPVENPLT